MKQAPSSMGRFLIAVIERRLEAQEKTRADLSRAMSGDGRRGFTEAALSRLFDGEASTPRDGWDHFVDGVAAYLDERPLTIWQEAVAAWEADESARTRSSLEKLRKSRRRTQAVP